MISLFFQAGTHPHNFFYSYIFFRLHSKQTWKRGKETVKCKHVILQTGIRETEKEKRSSENNRVFLLHFESPFVFLLQTSTRRVIIINIILAFMTFTPFFSQCITGVVCRALLCFFCFSSIFHSHRSIFRIQARVLSPYNACFLLKLCALV